MNTLRQAVQEYVLMRRDLGFKLHDAGKGLLDFVTFMGQVASLQPGPPLAESGRVNGSHPAARIDLPAREELRQRLEITRRRTEGAKFPEIGLAGRFLGGEETAAVRAEGDLLEAEAVAVAVLVEVDVALVAWTVAWIVLGLAVARQVRSLTELSSTVVAYRTLARTR